MKRISLEEITNILSSSTLESVTKSKRNTLSKLYATFAMIVADMSTAMISFLLAIALQLLLTETDIKLFPELSLIVLILPLFPLIYSLFGMYPPYGNDQIKEFRTITLAASFVYLALYLSIIILQKSFSYPKFALFFAWFFTLISAVPMRNLFKKILSKFNYNWWGLPVMIIGAGNAGAKLINNLKKQSEIGLIPVIAVDDNADKWGYISGIPIVGTLETIPRLAKQFNIHTAMLAMPAAPAAVQARIVERYSHYFSELTIIPEIYDSGLWVSVKDINGLLGFEIQTELLKKTNQLKKRLFDLTLAGILIVLTAPLQLLIAILIKLDSKGPVIFKQERCGEHNTRFNIFKFRSMRIDAEEKLLEVLKSNENLQNEFKIYHKIENDPRLTKIGKFIRKYSLDELPQFFNVIIGNMSLIGPRAYMEWEKTDDFYFILKAKPGISGLWQVSNRDSSFEDRILTDLHYIRSWSFSLDCVLVGKTIIAIIKGTGN